MSEFSGAINAGSVGGALTTATVATPQSLSALTLNATTINLNADVTTTGGQGYTGAAVLSDNRTLISSNNGNIAFSGTVNGTAAGAQSLTVNTGGTTTFGGIVGGTALASITTDAAGTTAINAATITTTGAQTYNDAVTLGANATLAAGAGNVTLASTVNGGFSLTVNSTGTTRFGGAVGGTTRLTSLTTNAVGTTEINGNVSTTGAQSYGDAVLLTGAAILDSNGSGNITFSSTVNGGQALTVNTGGTTTFTGAVGPLSSLSTNAGGTTAINGGTVTTTGDQTYSDAVVLGANTTLTSTGAGGNITLAGTVNGAAANTQSLTVNASGTTTLGGIVGGTTALTSLTTDANGTTAINTTAITTANGQTYNDAVTLGANATLMSNNSGNITFNKTVDGANSLTVNTAGTTTFGDVGLGTALSSLTTDSAGTTVIKGFNSPLSATIRTTGNQQFNDDVVLQIDTELNATTGNLTLAKSVNGAFGLTLNAQGGTSVTTLGGIVGGTTPLTRLLAIGGGSVTLSAVATAPAATITTSGALGQVFDKPVTLTANQTLNAGSGVVSFNSTVNGGFDLAVNTSGNTTFGGIVGGTAPLTSLTTNAGGTTAINTTAVTTSGTQTYHDSVTLGADTTLTSTTATFNGTVAGAGNDLTVTGNAVLGDAAADTVTGLGTLSVSGSTAINTSTVTSAGTQTYTGAVTIGATAGTATLSTTDSAVSFGNTTTLNSGLTVSTGTGPITFTGAVDGGQALTTNSTGTTTFSAPVGGATALASLTTNAGGATAINGGSVRTTGNQSYGDAVTLSGPATTIDSGAGNTTFNSTVDGLATGLTVNSTGNATFSGAVTTASLTTDAGGTTTIGGAGAITTSGPQLYNDNVALTANSTLTTTSPAGTITFNGNLTGGANNLTLNAAAAVTQGPTSSLSGAGLRLTGAGPYTLANSGNNFATLAGNPTGAVSYRDTDALTIGTVAAAAGLSAPTVTLQTGGLLTIGGGAGEDITSPGAVSINAGGVTELAGSGIVAPSLHLAGTGAFQLDPRVGTSTSPNDVTTLTATIGGPLVYSDATGVTIGDGTTGITTGGSSVAIHANGALVVNNNINTGPGTGTARVGIGVTGGATINGAAIVANTRTATAGGDVTLNRIDINDPPETSNRFRTIAQNTTTDPFTATFNLADFGFTDPVDAPANQLDAVIVNTLPANGTLTLNGGPNGGVVSAGQAISLGNILAGNFRFTPAVNFLGTTSFNFQVRDDGGGVAPSIDTSASASFTFNMIDKPDAPAGTNASFTLLEDGEHTLAQADFGFSDPLDNPPHNFAGVFISTLPTRGTLYEVVGGVRTPITTPKFITAARINANELLFVPDGNTFSNPAGSNYGSFTFQVEDTGDITSGAGGENRDASPNTLTFVVDRVADAPSGADKTINPLLDNTLVEDLNYTFTGADFGFSDTVDNPAPNNFNGVRITTLPTAGTLLLNGSGINAGDVIPVNPATGQIVGTLTFVPAAHQFGANYATFTFQVRDDGSTTFGGINLDPTPNVMTLNVTEVNDRPLGTDAFPLIAEDTIKTFAAADFGFSDPQDVPADNFDAVIITSLPVTGGVLRLNGTPITSLPVGGQVVTALQLAANALTYKPNDNQAASPLSTFTFKVRDTGGTQFGGLDTSLNDNTVQISVLSVNDAPDSANVTINLGLNGNPLEDDSYTFTLADFPFTDANDAAGPGANALQAVRLSNLTLNGGTLELNGAGVANNQLIQATDIGNGQLIFRPFANSNGANNASFTFQVQDSGGVAVVLGQQGVDLDSTPNTTTINVTPVNDRPVTADRTVPLNEDQPGGYTFSLGDFAFTDPLDSPAHGFESVIINSLPANGTLTLVGGPNGGVVTAGDVILTGSITANNLRFTPATNFNGSTTFSFQVRDNGGTANSGQNTSLAATITLAVNSVNDPPIGANNQPQATVGMLEDQIGGYTFQVGDFGFTDPADTPPNNFLQVRITQIPANGTLFNGSTPLTGTPVVPRTAIAAGNLRYVPVTNFNGLDNFLFRVQDDGGTAGGGNDTDLTARTMNINVATVNDAPRGANKTINMSEDVAYTIAAADFGFNDSSDSPVNALTNVIIPAAPAGGTLFNGASPLSVFPATIAVGDFNSNNVRFVPTAHFNSNGTPAFNVSFLVQDGGGTASGGADTDDTVRTLTFVVAPINDPPVGANGQPGVAFTINEDGSKTFTAADFGFTDPSDALAGGGPVNQLASVLITSPTSGGTLFNGTTAINATAGSPVSVPVTAINANQLRFVPTANANTGNTPSGFGFTFKVVDNGSNVTPNANTDATDRSVSFTVDSINDEPQGANKTINPLLDGTLLEDPAAPYTFSAGDFGFSDSNDNPPNAFANVRIVTAPALGTLRLNGTPVGNNTLIAASDIPNLTYAPAANGRGAGYASFTFQVQDNGPAPGVDTDQSPNTITLNVTPVNDPPVGTNRSVSTFTSNIPNSTYTFTPADFPFSDAADAPTPNALLNVRFASVNVTAGTLQLAGAPVTATTVVTLAQLQGGQLVYTPPATVPGTADSFTFRIQDDGGTLFQPGGQVIPIDTDQTARTMTINVSPGANREPVGQNHTANAFEDTDYVFTLADFPFNDGEQQPANIQQLDAVRIATLPGQGSLTLVGGPNNGIVSPGQFIPASAIIAGNFLYRGAANASGSPHTTFTFQVRDNGGTAVVLGIQGVDLDTSPNTQTINVLPVNDAPSGSDSLVVTREDSPYAFSASDFGFSDPLDNPANSMQAVVIRSLPASGTLEFAGTSVQVDDVIQVGQLGGLIFTPELNTHDGNAPRPSFTFAVQDDGGVLNGGQNTDQSPNLMTISVTSVADAPSGANSTVNAVEDTDYTFKTSDFGFSDAADNPANAFAAVRFTTTPAQGTITLGGQPISALETVSATLIASGQLRFRAASNAFGNALTSFTFQVQDDGSTASGGQNLEAAANAHTITVNVQPVNDRPQGADNTVVTNEDRAHTFAAADFGFSDPTDVGPGQLTGNGLLAVRIASLPTVGRLVNGGADLVLGSVVPVADITAGQFRFIPATDQFGSPYASFNFVVQDDGGTASGGLDLDDSANVMSIVVQSVNDEPAGADRSVTTLEDTPVTFAVGDFGFSDPQDLAGGAPNTLLEVLLTVPAAAAGTLRVDGVAQTPGTSITVSASDIASGKLAFTPAANLSGTAAAAISFRVRDNGGTLNTGVNTDQTPNLLTINVTPVTDAPVGTSATRPAFEDTVYTLSGADFGFTDPLDNPPGSLAAVQIVSLPTAGTLVVGSTVVTENQFITATELGAGLVRYTPAANANSENAPAPSFTFKVQDNGSNVAPNANIDATARTLSFNLAPVNDRPVGQDNSVTAPQNGTKTFSVADFPLTDPADVTPADADGNALLAVRIQSLPTRGTLTFNGGPNSGVVSVGQFIPASAIANGDFRFTPASGTSGQPYTSFSFFVQDDGGTAGGGLNLALNANTMTIDVAQVHQAPAGTNNTASTLEDTAYTLTAADFGFTDPSDIPPDSFVAVTFGSVAPAIAVASGGTLTVGGTTVQPGQSISLNLIQAGLVRFTPTANTNGTAAGRVHFFVQDDGSTAGGGVNIDPTVNTLSIDVASVNDAPAGASNSRTMNEDLPGGLTIAAADFGFTDPSDTSANAFQAVRISTLPTAGTLALDGIAVVENQLIQVSDINLNKLIFTPAANANGTPYSRFTFQVQDSGSNVAPNVNTDPTPDTLTINVNAVNDAPVGQNVSVSTFISSITPAYTFSPSDFLFTDPNDAPANGLANVRFASVNIAPGATLTLAGSPVTASTVVSLAQLTNGQLVYTTPTATRTDSFTFNIQDDGGTLLGGVDIDPTARTMTIDVRQAPNQPPRGTSGVVSTNEDVFYTVGVADFGFTDTDNPPHTFLNVRITGLTLGGGTLRYFTAPVQAPATIPVSDILLGRLRYEPPANVHSTTPTTPLANILFRVQDNGGTANGGVDIDQADRTLGITVNTVDDAPVGTPFTRNINERQSTIPSTLNFSQSDFGFSDPGDSVSGGGPAHTFTNVIIASLPTAGTLTFNSNPVLQGQAIPVGQLGNLVYTPAEFANGNAYATFTFRVQDSGQATPPHANTDLVARTVTINVDARNSAPQGTDNTLTINEDQAGGVTFTAGDFGFADPNDTPPNTFAAVRVFPATSGELRFNGGLVTAGGTLVPVGNLSQLVFTPAANAQGTPYATFTFQVQDNGGTANGGIDTDPTANTLAINVRSINDAPAGTTKIINPALNGTLLEDATYTITEADFGFTDLNDTPANAFVNVRIVNLPATGSLTLNGDPVSAGQLIAVSAIAANQLRFQPGLNRNNSNSPAAFLTFRVQDDGGTALGGIDTDTAAKTLTFNVTPVNDAPIGTSKSITVTENTDYTFVISAVPNDFGYADPADANDVPAQTFASVRIPAAPSSGTLLRNGTPITVFPATVLVTDQLVFRPTSNFNGTATFTFQVQDSGSNTAPSANTDPTPKTITLNVVAVNNAPAGANKAIPMSEDVPYSFSEADFGFTDANDAPPNLLKSVRITSVPNLGSLTNNGIPVAAGQFIAVSDLAGNLRYNPPLNRNSAEIPAPSFSFTFQVQDDGGVAGGGVDLEPVANAHTITFNIAAVNDPPSGADNTKSINEDQTYTFAQPDFGFLDLADSPAHTFNGVRIATTPTNGILTIDGTTALGAGAVVTATQINSNLLRFIPGTGGNGSPYATFTFQVQDNGGTTGGGLATDPNANVFAFNLVPVNDPPVAANSTVGTFENQPYAFTVLDFNFSDSADARPPSTALNDPNSLANVIITALNLQGGTLTNGGAAVVLAGSPAQAVIPVQDIASGRLRYTPPANASGTLSSVFSFKVQDNGGTANSGADTSTATYSMSVSVTGTNSAPSGADTVTRQIAEDVAGGYTFNTAEFGFSDNLDSPPNILDAVVITQTPNRGTLSLSGSQVAPGQAVSANDIALGRLVFTPVANANGANYASFLFQVRDDGGTASGGQNTDPTAGTYTFNVDAVNDAPLGAGKLITVFRASGATGIGTFTFAPSDFGFSDPSDNPANSLAAVRVTFNGAGTLTLAGAPVGANTRVTLAQLTNNGQGLIYTSAAANGTGVASVSFQVEDDGSGIAPNVNLDPVAKTISVNVVQGANQPPNGLANQITINEDTPFTLSIGDFPFTDAESNGLKSLIVATPPGAGTLTLNGNPVQGGAEIQAIDITAGRLVFTPLPVDSNATVFTTLRFQVRDDGGTANGGIDLDPTADTLTIGVRPVNDPPSGADRDVTTSEDQAFPFSLTDFPMTDLRDNPANSLEGIRIASLPTAGTLSNNGVTLNVGGFVPAGDISGGNFLFTPIANASGTPYATFTFQVQDNGGVQFGGNPLDPTPNTITVHVLPVNDPPTGANRTLNMLEDGTLGFTASDFGFSDPVDNQANVLAAVVIQAAPTSGELRLNNVVQTTFPLTVSAGNLSQLTFKPVADKHDGNQSSPQIAFRLQDSGTGNNTSATPNTLTISVTSVNDAPDSLTNGLVTIGEDGVYAFQTSDFPFADPKDSPANVLAGVRITTLPSQGTLTIGLAPAVNVAPGDFIPAAQIAGGQLRFTPAANANGPTYGQFLFQVRDNGGTAFGGVDTDQSPATMTVSVTAVNDVPRGTDTTRSVRTGGTLTFSENDFGFTDPSDVPPNGFLSVTIATLPTQGTLFVGGVAQTVPFTVQVTNIGQLTYQPAAGQTAPATFTFQVRDNGGGSTDTDPAPKIMTITIQQNDPVPPVGQNITVNAFEDVPYALRVSDFPFTDADGNNLAAVQILSISPQVTLRLAGQPVNLNDFISRNQLATAQFTVQGLANFNGSIANAFTFRIRDDGDISQGGANLSALPAYTAALSVAAVNDPPSGTDKTVSIQMPGAHTFAAGDFFTAATFDPNDTPPHNFVAVRIATLPTGDAAGRLTFDGVAVQAGRIVTLAELNAGRLVFTPGNVTENAINYASFTFQVQDSGGVDVVNGGTDLDPTANRFQIDVTVQHKAPIGTSNTVNGFEDQPFTFQTTHFGFTDPLDTPADSFTALLVTSLPSRGSLTLNNVPVAAGQLISVGDISLGNLRYSGVANESGTAYASFGFRVRDNGGTANGSQDTDQTVRVMTINLAAVNDRPVGANNAVSVQTGATFTFGAAHFPLTDPLDSPANILGGVQITGLPAAGQLQYNGATITAGQLPLPVTAAELAAGALRYIAPGSAGSFSFAFQVRDSGGTANSGNDLAASANTMTLNVAGPDPDGNRAPAGTNSAAVMLEDQVGGYTLQVADFGFTDPQDSPANNLLNVRITTLPATGTLRLNGTAVSAGQLPLTVSANSVAAGALTYSAPAHAFGTALANIAFQVQDDGGTANGGIDLDPSANVLTFNVTAVNDAPSGANRMLSVGNPGSLVFSAASFSFTDNTDQPSPNDLQAVKITSVPDPVTGTLLVGSTVVVAGDAVSRTAIDGGIFRFVPATGFGGNAVFTFQVQDDGGTANGGVDLDPTARTMTVNVTLGQPAANTGPTVQNRNVNAFEDTPYVFLTSDFPFTDTQNHGPKAVQIVTLPSAGSLTLNGGPVVANQFVQAIDIASGRLRYTGAANSTAGVSLTFKVQDDGGTNPGVDLSPGTGTVNISLANVNDAPVAQDNVVTILEEGTKTFGAADFGFADPIDSPANLLANVIITSLPAAGTLRLGGVAQTNVPFTVAAGSLATLTFVPAANAAGNNYASFSFRVQDNGGVLNNGVDTSVNPNSILIHVTGVNDAPAGTDRTVPTFPLSTTSVPRLYTVQIGDFGFTDPNDNPDNALLNVIVNPPTTGTLTAAGVTVTAANTVVSRATIAAGGLVYTAPTTGTTANFTFRVQDDGGVLNTGVDTDPTANTVTFNFGVPLASNPPAGSDLARTTLEDTTFTIGTGDFGFTDPLDTPANAFTSVIVNVPSSGTLRINGTPVTAGLTEAQRTVSVGDLVAGGLQFTPAANSTAAATIGFQVIDNGATNNRDLSANTLTINVTPVNDAPSGANRTINGALNGTLTEDGQYVFLLSDFALSDANDSPANTLTAVRITAVPAKGVLTVNDLTVQSGQFVLASDIAAGNFRYLPAADGSGAAYSSFTFQVQDNGGTANNGSDLDPSPKAMTLNVTSVADAPVGSDRAIIVRPSTTTIFSRSDFPLSDLHDTPANSLAAVRIVSLPNPLLGTLQVGGAPATVGQLVLVGTIDAQQFTFVAAAGAQGTASFAFQLQDDGSTANNGQVFAANANRFDIQITPLNNNAPSGTDKTVATFQDQTYTIRESDFGFNDPDGNNLDFVRISSTTGITSGQLQLNGANVNNGQAIAVADIRDGKLLYLAPATTADVTFTFAVQDDGGLPTADTDGSPNTFRIIVNARSHAPVGANGQASITQANPLLEDGVYVFAAADFGFTDPGDSPINTFAGVIITTVPTVGSLTRNGVALQPGTFVAAQDISGGLLRFAPPANANGNNLANFTFQVQDNGQSTAPHQNLDGTPRTMNLNVTSVNDPPGFVVGSDQSATDLEGRSTVLPRNVIGWAVNPNAGETGQTLTFEVTNNNNALFSQQPAVDAAGNLTFKPAPNAHGTAIVTVRLRDNGGVANGGVDLSPPQTFQINISKPLNRHNTRRGLDVTGDGVVVAGDALAVINRINGFGSGPVTSAMGFGPDYWDTTGDNSIAPNDVVAIINHINAFGSGTPGPEGEGAGFGEGEAPASDTYFYDLGGFGVQTTPAQAPANDAMADLIAMLANDVTETQARRRRLGQ
jgi:hypothetical protein